MKFIRRDFLLALVISLSIYFIFFATLYSKNNLIWGSDLELKHLPVRYYLHEQITKYHSFPFWTERAYNGFPIYADSENAYLNPVNIIALLVFGPVESIKILHLLTYLAGSLSFYFLTRRLTIGIIGYAISNTIFFFSFFMINHQIHFNMMMTLYLLPLNILVTDILVRAIKSRESDLDLQIAIFKSTKFAIGYFEKLALVGLLNSVIIAYQFYWGHYQTCLFIFVAQFFWAISSIDVRKVRTLLITIATFFVIGVSSILLSLPQTLPTYDLFKESRRFDSSTNITAFSGSFSPSMFTMVVYPQTWGSFNKYFGKQYDGNYSYTETYIYIGISVFILGFVSFLFSKGRLRWFYILSYFTFIFLTFLPAFPFISSDTPLISFFRYWNRSVVFLIFANSLLIGSFLSKQLHTLNLRMLFDSKFAINLGIFLFPLIYLLLVHVYNPWRYPFVDIFSTIYYRNLLFSDIGIKIIGIACVTISILAISILKKWNARFIFLNCLKILILVVILFDLRFFAQDAIDARVSEWNFPKVKLPSSLVKERVILAESNGINVNPLYLESWSPFGYSPYAESSYVSELQKVPLYVYSVGDVGVNEPINKELLREHGILGIIDDGLFEKIRDSNFELGYIKPSAIYAGVREIKRAEGNLEFDLTASQNTRIDTYIKADKNMRVEVNGTDVKWVKNGLYLSFDVVEGIRNIDVLNSEHSEQRVKIYYYPRPFYIGVFVSAVYVLLIFVVLMVVRFRRRFSGGWL